MEGNEKKMKRQEKETGIPVGSGEFVLRKHRGRKSKEELLALQLHNGGNSVPASTPLSTSLLTTNQKQSSSSNGTKDSGGGGGDQQQRQIDNQIEATDSGFEVDRAAIYNSMLPKEILDEDKWRWTPLCRMIIGISDATKAIAEKLAVHRLTAEEQKDTEEKLRTISEDAKRLSDSAEWLQMQTISAVTATMSNPEILGHGSLIQTTSTSNNITSVPLQQRTQSNNTSDLSVLRNTTNNKFTPFRVPDSNDTPISKLY